MPMAILWFFCFFLEMPVCHRNKQKVQWCWYLQYWLNYTKWHHNYTYTRRSSVLTRSSREGCDKMLSWPLWINNNHINFLQTFSILTSASVHLTMLYHCISLTQLLIYTQLATDCTLEFVHKCTTSVLVQMYMHMLLTIAQLLTTHYITYTELTPPGLARFCHWVEKTFFSVEKTSWQKYFLPAKTVFFHPVSVFVI